MGDELLIGLTCFLLGGGVGVIQAMLIIKEDERNANGK